MGEDSDTAMRKQGNASSRLRPTFTRRIAIIVPVSRGNGDETIPGQSAATTKNRSECNDLCLENSVMQRYVSKIFLSF